MHTIELELEDNLYQNIVKSGIDVQSKFKEFLFDLVDDGYPAISTEEAKKRVSDAVDRYRANPESVTELNDDFWNETEKRLLRRHQ